MPLPSGLCSFHSHFVYLLRRNRLAYALNACGCLGICQCWRAAWRLDSLAEKAGRVGAKG